MLHSYMCGEKFTQSLADPCVYTRNSKTDGLIILIIWVDDIIISGTTLDLLTSVKETLCRKFEMKDLGKLSWFLGTNFKCNKDAIEMGQTQYNRSYSRETSPKKCNLSHCVRRYEKIC